MEKQFNKQDSLVKEWMNELPMESPSPDFTSRVMERITAKATVTQYQPLISKRVWILIGILFVGALLWLYFNPSSEMIPAEATSFLEGFEWNNPLTEIRLPKTVVYAIGFMALFLLEIPFLKRIMDKAYI